MALRLDDRYIWLGFAAFFVVAAYGARYAITDILALTEIEPTQPEEDDERESKPERAIDLNVLRTLATSPNPKIANAAKAFIIQRFQEDNQATAVHEAGLISDDIHVRNRADMVNQYLSSFDAGDSLGDPGVGYEYALRARQRAQRVLGGPTDITARPRSRRGPLPDHMDDYDVTEITTPDSLPDLVGIEGTEAMIVPSPLDPVAGWTDVPRERTVSPGREDAAEARRRRREAVVVHDGT
ncbi:hypothetical protein LTR86_004138 [Recurvomyces mirabilis]|nr:hypothetical protein LTR86_004138 [Recurvomyces mirabilis]